MFQSSLYHEHGVTVYRYRSTFSRNVKNYVQLELPHKEYVLLAAVVSLFGARRRLCECFVPEKHEWNRLKRGNGQFVADLLGGSCVIIRNIEKEYLGIFFANPSLIRQR